MCTFVVHISYTCGVQAHRERIGWLKLKMCIIHVADQDSSGDSTLGVIPLVTATVSVVLLIIIAAVVIVMPALLKVCNVLCNNINIFLGF